MAFETFNLGNVIQTAEAIKGMRRQSTTDALREQYMGEQIQNMRLDRERQTNLDAMNFGKERAAQEYARAGYILQSDDPKGLIETQYPDIKEMATKAGQDWATITPEQLKQTAQMMRAKAGAEAGIAPSAPAGPMSAQGKIGADVRGGYLSQEQGDAALNPGMTPYQQERLNIERQKLSKPAGQFRALTPEEVQQVGLPAGTSAQVGPDGKIDVLSKRDNTGVLSQKDATTAKLKLNTVRLARQQINNIKEKFGGIQGTVSAGPFGQGKIPSEKGRAFDAAVNQMRSTLTSLTRVPGVGAMSDYETKLDQAKFPTRNDYETVTADQIHGIEDMLALIENGYTGLLSGGTTEQAPQPTPQQAPQQQGIDETGYNSLPSGTQYRAPDGTIRTKR